MSKGFKHSDAPMPRIKTGLELAQLSDDDLLVERDLMVEVFTRNSSSLMRKSAMTAGGTIQGLARERKLPWGLGQTQRIS